MKKLIAFSATLLFLFSASAFATPPAKDKKSAAKVKTVPSVAAREPVIGAPAPRPDPQQQQQPQQQQGKKKGWYKHTHNPHHPQSNNPGHAKRK